MSPIMIDYSFRLAEVCSGFGVGREIPVESVRALVIVAQTTEFAASPCRF